MKIIDISQTISADMRVYPGDPHFHSRIALSFERGDMCEVSELTIGSHCGTHVDAPKHMIWGGAPLESIPLDSFYGPCRVVTLPVPVITEKMLAELKIEPGERILLRTDPDGDYLKQGRFNPSVLSIGAAQYLAKTGIRLIGIDTATVENMEAGDGDVHRTLMNAGIAILEGLDLENAKGERYTLSALPLRIAGENGAPCRAVLISEDE